jgi:hypothetical protein
VEWPKENQKWLFKHLSFLPKNLNSEYGFSPYYPRRDSNPKPLAPEANAQKSYSQQNEQLGKTENHILSKSLANLLQKYPDLRLIIERWLELPEHIKAAIKALIQICKTEKKWMAKKETTKEPTKNKSELTKKDKAKDPEILATMTRNGKKVNIEKWHITGITIPTILIAGSDELNKEQKAIFELKFETVKLALKSKSKDLQDEAIDTMLGDLVAGAYYDVILIF